MVEVTSKVSGLLVQTCSRCQMLASPGPLHTHTHTQKHTHTHTHTHVRACTQAHKTCIHRGYRSDGNICYLMWHVWFRDTFKWTPRADYLVWWWWQYCATAGPMSDLMSLSALMASLMTALWFNVKHISVFSQMLIWDMISNSEKLGIQMMMTIERTPVAVLTGLLDGFGTDIAHCHWWTEVTCWLLKEIIFIRNMCLQLSGWGSIIVTPRYLSPWEQWHH